MLGFEFLLLAARVSSLSVLSCNIQQFSHNLPQVAGLATPLATSEFRFNILVQDIKQFLKKADIIVFSESFDNGTSGRLKKDLRALGYAHQTGVIDSVQAFENDVQWNKSVPQGKPLMNGGVFVVSRFPITHAEQHIYKEGTGADNNAAKGFIWVQLNYVYQGATVNVIGTHTQADDTAESKQVRKGQLAFLNQFANTTIPHSEIVLLVGDLNVDLYSPEATSVSQSAMPGLKDVTVLGNLTSYDKRYNAYLSYMDADTKTPLLLDYAFPLPSHVQIPGWRMTALRATGSAAQAYGVGVPALNGVATEASDHYPLMGFSPEEGAWAEEQVKVFQEHPASWTGCAGRFCGCRGGYCWVQCGSNLMLGGDANWCYTTYAGGLSQNLKYVKCSVDSECSFNRSCAGRCGK
ncbi:Endonuclease/exonuclease/phosphatase [Chytriomyces sp. MP71]|nr:Endonuclease/exonuclease/phosphatase [Chytriomyces sp. MP71]